MPTMHEFVEAQAGRPDFAPPVPDEALPMSLVEDMLAQLEKDNAEVFSEVYDYLNGDQLAPYAPQGTTDQIKDMQKRAITNLMPLIVNLPSQVSFVDGYRRGTDEEDAAEEMSLATAVTKRFSPEYKQWQKCRMDGRQAIIYRAALTYGHAFVQVDQLEDVKVNVLPTRQTIAYFDDPVNDLRPQVVVTVKRYQTEKTPGLIVAWDDINRYEIEISTEGKYHFKGDPIPHGFASGCPVVRYTCYVDDEGTTSGVIAPSVQSQDRVNQSTFSTDVTSTFGAFKVRTAAGLTPNFKTDANGELMLDGGGNPIPEPIVVSQARMLISDDPNTRFDQLDETPLEGFLRAEEQAIRNFAALNQFPPHILLGNISNLSAEALTAAEAQLTRFITFLHTSWGESHEELFRLMAEALQDAAGAASYGGEVRWRKVTQDAFPAVVDGLGKLVQMVGLPRRAAWAMIPGASSGDLEDWEELKSDEDDEAMLGMTATPANAAAREYRAQPSHAQMDSTSSAATRSVSDGSLS